MKIYIAYGIKNEPLSAILCDDDDKAEAVFTAMKLQHVSTEVIDPQDCNAIANRGVVHIFGSESVLVGSGMGERYIKILKRGL